MIADRGLRERLEPAGCLAVLSVSPGCREIREGRPAKCQAAILQCMQRSDYGGSGDCWQSDSLNSGCFEKLQAQLFVSAWRYACMPATSLHRVRRVDPLGNGEFEAKNPAFHPCASTVSPKRVRMWGIRIVTLLKSIATRIGKGGTLQ